MTSARHSNLIAALWMGAVLLCTGVVIGATAQAEELTVVFRRHSVITVELNGAQLPWVSVAKDGSMVDRTIPVGQIQSLFLSKSRSSDLLAAVRQNLQRLGDDDYNTREKAEIDLAKTGGSFRNMLELYADNPSMEVRHRVQRLLKKFARSNSPPVELDRLVLTDGSVLEGEARDFKLKADYRGTNLLLERQSVLSLQRPSDMPPPAEPEPARIEIINQHKEFVAAGQQELRFETNANGDPFPDRANIDRAFTDLGVRFRNASDQGYVGVSVFSFKYDPLPVGGRSVCLYSQGQNRKQFQGVMEISFCVPGSPERPAGVYEAGLFIARVKHSRDLVMEAYNAQGHVLATVEATDQQCVFTGIKSNELITKLKIFSNPWLDKLSRKIDVDFAIDTLKISPPVEVSASSGQVSGGRRMHLKNGDLLIARSITVTPDLRWRVRLQEPAAEFMIDMSEVSDISFGVRDKPAEQWSAMLVDGSIVDVTPGRQLMSATLNRALSSEEIVAPGQGKFGKAIDRSIAFVLKNVRDTGYIAKSDNSNENMYGHGFSMLFLSQAYGMTQKPEIGKKLRKAVELTCTTQNEAGGWRYQPRRSDADLSITVCQIMGLRGARDAGIDVPDDVRKLCIDYVKRSQNKNGSFRYTLRGGHSTFAMTAAGVTSLYSSGIYEGEQIESALKYLKKFKPSGGNRSSHYFYSNYYAVQAMWHAGGEYWNTWYPAIRDELVKSQSADGSWSFSEAQPPFGAAMGAIILQMPLNYVPVFSP